MDHGRISRRVLALDFEKERILEMTCNNMVHLRPSRSYKVSKEWTGSKKYKIVGW
jgi:hypothetical protein